jgi:hypothetical protein
MGKPVEFADVAARVAEFGPLATLVTVGDSGAPHVGTVLVSVDGDRLAVEAGPTTRSNVLARPAVTLAWLGDHDYQLIVDGTATAGEPTDGGLSPISIEVAQAILHRRADRPDAGPSCVALRP